MDLCSVLIQRVRSDHLVLYQVLNLFVTLVVNAFDFREKDDNSDGVDGAKSILKKIFKARRSCLLEENYRGSFRPCKLGVIESKHPDEQSNGVSLATHTGDQNCKEYCKSIEIIYLSFTKNTYF